MPRDINVLSEKDLFEKTKSLAEFVRSANIKLKYLRGQNWCQKTGLYEYTVNVSTPPVQYIPKYTALLHELGHIIYKTPFYQIDKLLKAPAFVDNSNYYFMCYNILEDERMESHLTKGYLAYKKRFRSCLKNLGQNNISKDSNKTDPSMILFAIRTIQDDLVSDQKHYKVYKKAMEDIKLTDRFGSLKILVILKPYIDEWLNSREKPISRFSRENIHSEEQRKHINMEQDEIDSIEEPIPEEIEELVNGLSEGDRMNDEEINDIIKESKEQGEREHQEIEELILKEGQKFDGKPPEIILLNRKEETPVINKNISTKLNRIFRKLQMGKKKIFNDYQGFEINTDQFIENLIKGSNISKSFNNHKLENDASIIISVDGSTSMNKLFEGKKTRITIARDLVATLFDSLKNIEDIYLKGNIWSSNKRGKIAITEINSRKDVKYITTTDSYNATPTHMGIKYSIDMLNKMKGKKKLLIIITDGSPNYHQIVDGNSQRVNPNTYFPIVKKSYEEALKVTPNILFVVITPYHWINERFVNIFGVDRVVYVDQAKGVNEKVIKRFKEVVMRTIAKT